VTTSEGNLRTAAEDDDPDESVAPLIRRAPRISQADVFRTADELLVEGHRPTIDRVRMRLGRGSPNTINDHLDAWWTKLGSRLRDLPGREFPQLPERVAEALQRLWNEALESAHDALRGAISEREHAVVQGEQALEARARRLDEREQAADARADVIEESISLAREHLSAASRRAERLETTLQERDSECMRMRAHIETLSATLSELRGKLDAMADVHQAERTRLEERYAAAEARWLTEVDRARQGAKELERQIKEVRTQVKTVRTEREHMRIELIEARAALKTATAVRAQLEERLRVAAPSARSRRSARPTRAPPKRVQPLPP
jgi:hypothetical protein